MSQLYETLKKRLRVCKLNSSGTEVCVRCPFCLDSIKDPFKGHMYIENNPPFRYFCQRCNASGRVNIKFLNKLGVEDFRIYKEIEKAGVEYSKKIKIKYGSDLSFLNNKDIKFPIYNKNDKIKNEYIESRLGIKIEAEDIEKYKIVYNLNDFLNLNNLTSIINKNIKNFNFMKNVETINKNCVGFLSQDKSTIIFRSLDKNKTGYRYNNFTIFPELDSKKTYMLSNEINLANKEFDIIITEGIFDIIGVFNHIYDKKMKDNTIYLANAGKSYVVTANLLKKLSILNSNIYIYSDGDVDTSFYKELMKQEIYYGCNGLNIYYNQIGKDFGVSKEEIKLSNKIEL